MRRNATLSLEGFDPEVIEAAREVAQRAGVPLETWVASVVAPDSAPEAAPGAREAAAPARPAQSARSAQPPARSQPARTQSQPVQVHQAEAHAQPASPARAPRPRVKAQAEVSASPPAALPAPAPTAAAPAPEPAGPTIAEMMRRLDALDRSLIEDRRALREAAGRTAPPATAPDGAQAGPAPSDQVAERLAEIERRMGDLNAHLGGPRPLGRRGRPIAAEMREAVEEVRRRQRELDGGEAQAAAPAAAARETVPSPAVAELQAETRRLRESLGSLATGRDVGALERAMQTLAADVQRAREPGDVAASVDVMRGQVERLAEEVADNVHARLASEVERLASRADGSLDGAGSRADRTALDGMHRELDDIRHLIAGLAGPERIQGLYQGMHAISSQIAALKDHGPAPAVAELKPLLEEIRTELDAGLRRPAPPSQEIASMHALLRGLAEKVDHVGAGSGSLDALEREVVALARRLDSRPADPSLASLERTMDDLLTQVVALRDDTSVESAVERATRRALAEVLGGQPDLAGGARVEALRADLEALSERQVQADRRMQATMDSLNAVLGRLVDRLDAPEALGEQLLASTALGGAVRPEPAPPAPAASPRASRAPRAPRREEPARAPAPETEIDTFILRDELLEPGASRPPHAPAAPMARETTRPDPEPAGADIKTNFIAAARRAAQAAQADIAAEMPAAPERREGRRGLGVPVRPAAPTGPGLVGRLLAGLDKRRRPLLLGLAAVVLVLGAYQAYQMNVSEDEPAAPVAASRPVPAVAAPALAEAPPAAPAQTAAPAQAAAPAPAVDGPTTTQALAEARPPEAARPAAPRAEEPTPAAARPAIPQVPAMAALGRDLAAVPANLASLKQAALDGDGAAVYELAAREADGRGMPRDLALAAKLYEKLAGTGYAPAQFKLGSFYEKGSGVTRDLTQAKTWYGRAADQGNIRAMHNLAVLHAENPGPGGKPDFATAASWFRRAAEFGVRDSQYNLAVLYARGLGLTQDLVQSYAWFSAAAAQGDEEAGRKREDVAAKLAPKDLAAARSVVAGFRPKPAEPVANDLPPAPPAKPALPAAMSLLGAPPPGTPTTPGFTPTGRAAGV